MFKNLKKKWNSRQIKIKSLKAEIYDLTEKIEMLKNKNKNDEKILKAIKNLSRDKKKIFYDLIGEENKKYGFVRHSK